MMNRILVTIALVTLSLTPRGFAAEATNQLERATSGENFERLVEHTRMLRQRGGGDAKVWKKYREAGKKAEKSRDPVEAERQYAAAAREAEGFKARDKRIPESLRDWGRVLYQNRKFNQSLRVYEDLVAFHQRDLGSNHTALIHPLVELAGAAIQVDRLDLATNSYQRAQEIAELQIGPYSATVGELIGLQGVALMEAGRTAEAEAMLRKALQILQTPPGAIRWSADGTIKRASKAPAYVAMAGIYNNLALLYREVGRAEEAESYFRQSMTVYEREVGKTSEGAAMAAHNLGMFYLAQGKADEAQPLVERALAIREKILGKDHQIVADSLIGLAEVYRTQGRTADASKLEERVLKIRRGAASRP